MATPKNLQFKAFLGHNGWLPGLIGIGSIATALLAIVFVTVSDLRRSGSVTADARVIEASTVGLGSKTEYRLAVSLEVDGQTYSASRYVHWDFHREAEGRETIPVQYDPANPNRIWIVPIRSEPWYGTMRTGGVVLAMLMALWCRSIWKLAGRTVATLETGERRMVPVTSHVDMSGSKNDNSRIAITWLDPGGTEQKSNAMAAEEAAKYPVGSDIEIVLDPDGKLPSRWVDQFK